jgi:hypothetical protein
MKTSELMIGNYVTDGYYDSFKTIFEVESISEKGINLSIEDDGRWGEIADRWIEPEYRFDLLFGIPLTEDWLLKFGFDLINNEYHQSRNHELKLYWTVNKNKMIPEFNEKRFVTGYDFKYVHQLQNLYFILTGEELTIKNK